MACFTFAMHGTPSPEGEKAKWLLTHANEASRLVWLELGANDRKPSAELERRLNTLITELIIMSHGTFVDTTEALP